MTRKKSEKNLKKILIDAFLTTGKWALFHLIEILALISVIVTFYLTQKELQLQRFENNLFTLLENHHNIVDNLYWEDKIVGRDAFRIYRERICLEGLSGNTDIKYNSYVTSYAGMRSLIETYAKSLATILFFIESSNILSPKEKQFYTSIVTDQLSAQEKVAIFYHAVLGPQDNNHIQKITLAEKGSVK